MPHKNSFYYPTYLFFLLLCNRKTKIYVNLIIDIGNTATKIAIFEQGNIKETLRCSNQSLEGLAALCRHYAIQKGILSSVISINETIRQQLSQLPFPILEFTYQTSIPIRNLHLTFEEFGINYGWE